MAYSAFKKYVWLIDQVNRREGITRKELEAAWRQQTSLSKGQDYSRDSFNKDRKAIKRYFDLDIYCEKNRYYVRPCGQPSSSMLILMEKLAVDNMLEEFAGLKGRIVYEPDLRVAKGRQKEEEKLRIVAEAMSRCRKLEIKYQPFGKEEGDRTVHPYCVKMHQQRMYLIGRVEEHGGLRTYAMDDRMISVKMLDEAFTMPGDFDAEAYFRTAFGIVPQTDRIKPQRIVLRAEPTEAGYLKAVRLHPSQKTEEETASYTDFSYYLAPTIDFLEEILKRRGKLTVLEPIELTDSLLSLVEATRQRLEKSRQVVLERQIK